MCRCGAFDGYVGTDNMARLLAAQVMPNFVDKMGAVHTMLHRFYNFKLNSDTRGSLVAIEVLQDIHFEIKRIYYIFGTREHVRRGMHAHKQLQQVLICVHGSCTILLDNGAEREEIILNNPTQGLFIDRMIWREMYNFSSDAVLLVLASKHYCEEDYIRDYHEFKLLYEKGY